jgi:tRNA A-37 threonylcarbamoyl transferase component Bud32
MDMTTIESTVESALRAQGIELPAPPWAELGSGIWGTVFDLGDGSVLKLIRKRGGLGSPAALIQRETQALEKFGGQQIGGLQLPTLIGHGDLSLPANPFVAPLEGWIRLSKVDGQILSARIPSHPEKRHQLGEQLGAAIAQFHEDATPLASDLPKTDPIERAVTHLQNALAKPEDKNLCRRLLERWQQSNHEPTFLHGDINFSNVLVDDAGRFSLLDFAECGFGPAHADFRHFEDRPEFRDALFLGYQAASGAPIDMDVYYLAATVNSLGSLYFGGAVQPGVTANDPRVGMRLRGMVRHCAQKAGIEE